MKNLVLIVHNVRSCHNVGSLLRTAEGLAVTKVYLTGYTPYPVMNADPRLPHLAAKIDRQIHKTALGAEKLVRWSHESDINKVIRQMKHDSYKVVALEQDARARSLSELENEPKIAVIVGREVEGLEPDIRDAVDLIVEIPMFGRKESFNVVQAAAMALYHYRFN